MENLKNILFAPSPTARILLAILSGILIGLSWYFPFTLLAFIGFVPLLLVEHALYKHNTQRSLVKLFFCSYITFVVWNIVVYWWLWNASGWATLGAWGANSFLMTFPMLAYHQTKKWSGNKFGFFVFVSAWMSFEYIHLNWQLSWVWLNLGNIFAQTPHWVQWIEHTGNFGSSMWVLFVNIGAMHFLLSRKYAVLTGATLVLPIIASYIMLWQYEAPEGKDVDILVVQPNLDCYEEKFTYNAKTRTRNTNYVPYEEQVERFLKLTKEKLTPTIQFVAWPETSLHEGVAETNVLANEHIRKVYDFMAKYPNTSIITGLDTYEVYGKEAKTPSARYRENIGYYDYFNAAMFIDEQQQLSFYRKSKLVIGAETIPYPTVLKFMMLNFGGISGGLGKQKEAEVFFNTDSIGVAPLICYESVYGEYVTEFIRKGAEILFIITNDGWWGETPGYKQHLDYARLRAIETRRYIARAANTGVSGFISPTGEAIKFSNYDEMIALSGTIKTNNEITFYSRYGDYLGRLAAFLSGFMLISAFVKNKVLPKRKTLKR